MAGRNAPNRLSRNDGSGVAPDNVAGILARVDGVIVASSPKRDGDWWNEVEVERVRALVSAAGWTSVGAR